MRRWPAICFLILGAAIGTSGSVRGQRPTPGGISAGTSTGSAAGTATAPSFIVVDTDWESLSASGIGAAMYPAFGDLDNVHEHVDQVFDCEAAMPFLLPERIFHEVETMLWVIGRNHNQVLTASTVPCILLK